MPPPLPGATPPPASSVLPPPVPDPGSSPSGPGHTTSSNGNPMYSDACLIFCMGLPLIFLTPLIFGGVTKTPFVVLLIFFKFLRISTQSSSGKLIFCKGLTERWNVSSGSLSGTILPPVTLWCVALTNLPGCISASKPYFLGSTNALDLSLNDFGIKLKPVISNWPAVVELP